MVSLFTTYPFRYELSDKQEGNVSVEILNKGTEQEEIFVTGRLKTVGLNGKESHIDYVVDKDSFHLLQLTDNITKPVNLDQSVNYSQPISNINSSADITPAVIVVKSEFFKKPDGITYV